MGEGVVLELTNDWYLRARTPLQTVLMESKSCLTMVRILQSIGDNDSSGLEDEIELVWYQFVRMWEFIPWFVFVATGSVSVYTSIRMLMCRYYVVAKPKFVEDYRAMRK